MDLGKLKTFIENQEKQIFDYGLSLPFTWRGSYVEVGFSILKETTNKADILASIEQALTEKFIAYKGGEYKYNKDTPVNFERDYSEYSDGGYCRNLIAEIEESEPYETEEQKLIKLAFS